MLVDFNQKPLKNGQEIVSKQKVVNVTKDEDGNPQEDVSFETGVLTLGDCSRESLLKGIEKISIEETMLRYNLYNKIKDNGEVELTDEEVSKLKELINNRYEILLSGQLLSMLGQE